MFRQGKKTLAGLAALAALGLGAGAVAQAGSSTSSARPAAHPAKAAVAKSESPNAPDTDYVQSGDQKTPDNADTPDKAGSSEQGKSSAKKPDSAGETGSEVPNGDGRGGHADEPGNPNADHQFNGQE